MKSSYSIARSELISALETCVPITNKRHVRTVMGCARLKLNGSLQFAATDTRLSVVGERSLEKTGEEVEFGVDPSKLLEAVRKMPEGTIALTYTEKDAVGRLTAKSGAKTANFTTIPAGDMDPPVTGPRSALPFVPAKAIASLIERVRFAVKDNNRPQTDGIQFVLKNRKLTAMAMSGAGIVRTHIEVDTSAEFLIHIPLDLVPSLISAAGAGQDLQIGGDDGFIFMKSSAGLYRFLSQSECSPMAPTLDNLFAQDGSAPLKLKTEPLVDALGFMKVTVGSLLDSGTTLIREGTSLRLESSAGEGQARDAEDVLEVDDGESWKARFAPDALMPALTQAGDEVEFVIARGGHAVIRGTNYSCCVAGMMLPT